MDETDQESATAPVPVYYEYAHTIMNHFYSRNWERFKSSEALLVSMMMIEANKVVDILADTNARMTRADLHETLNTVILSLAAQILFPERTNPSLPIQEVNAMTADALSSLAQYDARRLGQE